MIFNSEAESIVKMDSIFVKNIIFQRTADEVEQASLKLQFSKSYTFNNENQTCLVEIGCSIDDEEERVIHLEASICALFSCDCEDTSKRKTLLTKNTLAILFPYLRSLISLVTAQPGLSPIVLPPMNIEALFPDNE